MSQHVHRFTRTKADFLFFREIALVPNYVPLIKNKVASPVKEMESDRSCATTCWGQAECVALDRNHSCYQSMLHIGDGYRLCTQQGEV